MLYARIHLHERGNKAFCRICGCERLGCVIYIRVSMQGMPFGFCNDFCKIGRQLSKIGLDRWNGKSCPRCRTAASFAVALE